MTLSRDIWADLRHQWTGAPGRCRAGAEAGITCLARLLVRVFFRDVEVTSGDSVPEAGPVVVVANHQNGLVDGLLLIAACDRFPRFVGKSTLWRIVPLRPFLSLAGVVPVRRAADTAASMSPAERRSLNDLAFDRCGQVLAAGGVIAVFPEGISHDEASLQDLRTGAARIALGAASEHEVDVALVAAGLAYDDKTRFRSRALVAFGRPRAIRPYVEGFGTDPGAAVKRLTADITADLSAAAPDYPSTLAAHELRRIAALAIDVADGGQPPLSDLEAVARALARVGATEEGGPIVGDLRRRLAAYEATLALLGLTDGDLGSSTGRRVTRIGWSMIKVAVGAPVAAVGLVIHALPYLIIEQLARLPRNQSMKATVKVLGSAGLYATSYAVIAALIARRRRFGAALGALVAAPVSGWVSLLSLEWLDRVAGIRRAASSVREDQATVKKLMTRRAEIAETTRGALASREVIDRRVRSGSPG